MFIQTEPQDDPNVMKFIPGREVLSAGMVRYLDAEQAMASPLAARLFAVEGVLSVAFDQEAIILHKAEEADWRLLKAPVLGIVMEHFVAGRPIVEEAPTTDTAPEMIGEGGPVAEELRELIDTRIRPAVTPSGGDVVFRGIDAEGIVHLETTGSAASFLSRIEAMLKHYVPEVAGVREFLDTAAKPGLATPEGRAVREVLEERINPAVAGHGGHVALVDVQEDTVYIRLEGGCQGCGMADVTLKHGIEVEIRRAVPAIAQVLDVTDHAGGTNPYYQPGKGGVSAV
jgi:Fe-S cluster biogenesis protein NfuA